MIPDTCNYPPEAYAGNGILWWKLEKHPGTMRRYGVERKLMAWLAFNKDVGDVFTTKEVRAALGAEDIPNDDEHLQRRVRQLRKDGWEIPSTKYDRNLPLEHYRIDSVGWHPGLEQPRPAQQSISDSLRRQVLERDGWRCAVCGVGSREPYPENKLRIAVLTVGHVLSDEFGGSTSAENLRAECARCNEPVRTDLAKPESVEEVVTAARNLSSPELRRLSGWLKAGMRSRDRVDALYDRIRKLPEDSRSEAAQTVIKMTKE